MFVTLKDRGIVLSEHFGSDGLSHNLAHFLLRRPQVTQVDRLTVNIGSNRVFRQIDIDGSRERIGHHQGRRGEKAGPHLWVNASFEVAVTTQHRRDNKVILLHCLGDWLRQGAAIANAIVDCYCACHEGM